MGLEYLTELDKKLTNHHVVSAGPVGFGRYETPTSEKLTMGEFKELISLAQEQGMHIYPTSTNIGYSRGYAFDNHDQRILTIEEHQLSACMLFCLEEILKD